MGAYSCNTSSYPQYLTLCISNVCNQRCRFCDIPHHDVVPKFLSIETIQNMDWLCHVNSICVSGSGEALTHPHYCKIIEEIRKKAPESNIMLYTNGLALHGEKLDATIANCDQIHISQNYLDKKTYQSVMHRGNFENSMRNLRELADKKSPKHYIQLSFVLLRETLSSIPKFIGVAKTYGFQKIIVAHGRQPIRRYSYEMPLSSYAYELTNDFINENLMLAKMASVDLAFPLVRLENSENMVEYPGWDICMEPFKSLQIYLNYKGDYNIDYCCRGSAGIIINEKSLSDIESIWHNTRIKQIRNTVNDMHSWYKNKMCMRCRCGSRFDDAATQQEFYSSFNIKLENNHKKPIYFETLYI